MSLLQSIRFQDILLLLFILLLLLLSSLVSSESNPDVQFLSRGQSFVRYAGQSVEMDCEFYAEAMDMFQHHIIWYKSQQQQQHQYMADEGEWEGDGKIGDGGLRWEGEGRGGAEGRIEPRRREREGRRQWGAGAGRTGRRDRVGGGAGKVEGAWGEEWWGVGGSAAEEDVWSPDDDDRMQVNQMGRLLEPFASTGRYRVDLSQQPPTYRLRLLLTDVTPADSGAFSCHVNSINDAGRTDEIAATSIIHALHVRAAVETIRLTDDQSTLLNLSNFFEASRDFGHEDAGLSSRREMITVTDGRPNTVGCVVTGGYPPPVVDFYDGQRQVTKLFALMRTYRYEGRRGLKVLRFVSARWSDQFKVTESDNGKVIKCEAGVDGLTPFTASARLNVLFAPVVMCRGIWASTGERNVFLSCQVRSNPYVSSVFWTFEDNGTSIISTPDTANDHYWTVVKTQSADFRLEVRLYIRQLRVEHFRCYRVTTENSLGRTGAVVQLLQRSRPLDRTTNSISFDAMIKARRDEATAAAEDAAIRDSHHQQQQHPAPSLHKALFFHFDSSDGASQTKEPLPILSVLLFASFSTCLQTQQSA